MHVMNNSRGFSLIEMAVVMLIMGSLLSGLLVALTQTSDNTRITTAKSQMIKIEEALYAFAQAHGRLPCPATSVSNGYESPDDGSGDCTQTHGFVPSASLSLYSRVNDDALMLDPWSNPYRYSVAPYEVDPADGGWVDSTDADGDFAFTDRQSLRAMYGNNNMTNELGFNTGEPSSMLRICEAYDCSGDVYSQVSPAIVLSMGPNWINMIDDCSVVTDTDEVENAGAVTDGDYCLSNTNTFVDTEYNEENFDDIIIWLSPYILFSRMIDATQLP